MTQDVLRDDLSPYQRIRTQMARVIQGQQDVVRDLLTAFIAGGHVLLEGVPGTAKTLTARALASALSIPFTRIQFTPDLMPSDITGVNVYLPSTGAFEFRPGPLFSHIVLADEINRAPAKTQSALLEAMQERQVSIDGLSRPLPELFFVVATQNPIEYEGTYPLPEAQLDRFLMKVKVEYPAESDEREMLARMHELGAESMDPARIIEAVASEDEILDMRRCAHRVQADRAVLDYIVDIIRTSRSFPSFALAASPRAAVALLQASKALAALQGRSYLTPDEVQVMVPPVLRHRVSLTPEAEIEGLTPDECLLSLVRQVAVPRFQSERAAQDIDSDETPHEDG